MFGPQGNILEPDSKGIIPRIMYLLFILFFIEMKYIHMLIPNKIKKLVLSLCSL